MLDDEQYASLTEESRRSGLSVGALIRAAVDQRFGRAGHDLATALDALNRSAGVWEFEGDGESYVDGLRRGHWRSDDVHP